MTDKILLKNKTIFYGILGLLIAAYAYLSFNAPVQPSARPEFALTGITKILVQLSFMGLVALTWIFGATAIWRGFLLAKRVENAEFGKILFNLSLGISILLLGFIAGIFMGQ